MNAAENHDAGTVRLAGRAIGVTGWFNGFTEPNLGGRGPEIQRRLGANDATLAAGWAGWPVGMLLASFVGGRILERVGARTLLVWGATIYWGCFMLLGLATNPVWFFVAMFGVGLGNGFFDVAWGRLSPWYARRRQEMEGASAGRPAQLLWALFSAGSVLAVLLSMAMVALGVPIGLHLAAVGAVALGATLLVARRLPNLKDTPRDRADTATATAGRRARAPWALRRVGIVAFCSALPVGMGYLWAPVYLARLGVHGPFVMAGLLAFTAAETLVRFGIGLVSKKVTMFQDPVKLAVVSGIVAFAGILLIALPGTTGPAIAGFALLAGGMASIAELAFDAAPRIWKARESAASALITRYNYFGLTLGPVVIGPLSSSLGSTATAIPLRIALGSLAILPVVMILLARSVRAARVDEAF